MVQPDIKRLVAYSSVAHMGFVMLGMFSFTEMGMQGALYQMLNHGISTGALFLLVGFIYERRHTRAISEFGGIANVMPIYATIFVITTMSSIGLPFLNGFVGEFLTMLGMWNSTALADFAAGQLELRGDDVRRNGRDFRGGLSAVDGSARFLRQNHESEQKRG
jgi:NADH-quinone oxidoreductase subunit M